MKTCDGTSASAGASFKVGTRVCERRILALPLNTARLTRSGARGIQPQAGLQEDARAAWTGQGDARRRPVRHPEARRLAPALRLQARARRCVAVLVRAQGAEPRPGAEAPGRTGRGPPA